MSERILAWHFVRLDGTTNYQQIPIKIGQVLEVEGPLALGRHGLHASRRVIDALKYAPGPVACRVEVWGDVIEDEDKLCGRYRKCLAMVDATNILHEFACLCAERALKREREAGREPDPRSWAAIDAKRRWLQGEIDADALEAAWAAALDAARAAAWAAAWAAVWEAAWTAARAAAWAAAWAAVWEAAWTAARAAAWTAELDWQNTELTRMLEEAMRGV